MRLRKASSHHPWRCPAGFIVLLVLALYASAAFSIDNTILLESGLGFHHSTRSEAVFLSYQNDAPIFGVAGYYEVLIGGWNGPNGVVTAGLGRGISLVSDRGD